MNYLTKEKAVNLIGECDLPSFFVDVIYQKLKHPLDIHFSCPDLYYMTGEEQAAFNLGDIIPLWSSHSGYSNYAYDMVNKDFITFDIESGEITERYSWDHLMKKVIDLMIEFEFDESENIDSAITTVKGQLRGLRISNYDSIVRELQNGWAKSP